MVPESRGHAPDCTATSPSSQCVTTPRASQAERAPGDLMEKQMFASRLPPTLPPGPSYVWPHGDPDSDTD